MRRKLARDPADDVAERRPRSRGDAARTRLVNQYESWVDSIGARSLQKVLQEKKAAEKPLIIPAVEQVRQQQLREACVNEHESCT